MSQLTLRGWGASLVQNFADWWSALKSSEWVKGASDDTDIVKWTFKDGTQLEVKQEEHSVRPNTAPPFS